jgi:hypothetical protein
MAKIWGGQAKRIMQWIGKKNLSVEKVRYDVAMKKRLCSELGVKSNYLRQFFKRYAKADYSVGGYLCWDEVVKVIREFPDSHRYSDEVFSRYIDEVPNGQYDCWSEIKDSHKKEMCRILSEIKGVEVTVRMFDYVRSVVSNVRLRKR